MRLDFRNCLLATAAAVALPTVAYAQSSSGAVAPAAATSAAPQTSAARTTDENEIVVVGSADPNGQRKLEAGYAVTSISSDAIRTAAPISAADVLKLVPGVWAETTSGVSGPNVMVRGFPTGGDAKFVTMQIDSLPIYPASSLSFLDNSTQFRLDETVKRVETTIGGQAVLLGNGQPGATVNFVQKNGKSDPGGVLMATVGTGSFYRIDGYYGADVGNGWYASVGGFYRNAKGVRNTQFPADDGHQISGTLMKEFEDGGSFTLYARNTYDRNAFFTAVPLIREGTGDQISLQPYPGFDPTRDTFLGNANRIVTFDIASNGTNTPVSKTVDLSRGRGIDLKLVGLDFDKQFGAFSFSNKLAYSAGNAPTIAQFTGATPVTLGSFINSQITTANSNAAALAAAGRPATAGTATLISSGAALTDLNTRVIGIGVFYVNKKIRSFQDEARLSTELFSGNRLTAGVYFADYSSDDTWYTGHQQLMTVQNNAQPINLVLNNGVRVTNGSGVYGPTALALHNIYNGRNTAVFVTDQWDITDRLKVDIGGRYEWETIDATFQNSTKTMISTDPLALYDYNVSVLLPSTRPVDYSGSRGAFNVDANYEIAPDFNAFIGYNKGYSLPTFDDLRAGVTQITNVDQIQGGIKSRGSWFALNLTGFYNKFQGQPSSQLLADGTLLRYLTSSDTYGLEFDGVIRPFEGFSVSASGAYQHGKYTAGGPGITGNQVLRQPDFQARVTPSYTIDTPIGGLTLYATGTFVTKRYADLQNLQPLPGYETLDIGASFEFENGMTLAFTGTNVTNTLGITEGNSRVVGSGVDGGGVFLGRPLFGPNYQASLRMKF
ncbi:TonB-dependent receptor [Sphingobium indicum]|uniref:TonB-dependent receptor n=2 Tax=Sphingobium indicum TaxID=332055 RepID=A0A1L5BRU4_SPHIB|nr:TonB-dependent receptor [Sphingobium indicum]APL95600.1 TonB-dependent receptor [Sphingobium indicum B90A]KEZ00236.1 TonB-dependent receptor [Sphingomonas sp. BHC-A]NYI24256.1 outer membrane receptor protein involved in Fe transport [Sphingobium indicum]RYL99047.1 TonB-dependent receptor [Sphingobium indicum]